MIDKFIKQSLEMFVLIYINHNGNFIGCFRKKNASRDKNGYDILLKNKLGIK